MTGLKDLIKTENSALRERIKTYKKPVVEEIAVCLIDCSSSMLRSHEGAIKIDAAKEAIHELLSTPHRVEYALISFSSSIKIWSQSTLNYANLRRQIDLLEALGSTEMAEGLRQAIDIFEGDIFTPKKRVILLSDGEPTCTVDTVIEQAKRCREKKIIIDTIAFGDYCNEDLLKILAQMTGGQYHKAAGKKILIEVFRQLKFETRYLEHKDSPGSV